MKNEVYWEFTPEKLDENVILYGFAQAYKSETALDFIPLVRKLPEKIVLCSPNLIAGKEHVRRDLFQAAMYWGRGISLARNKSLDLLMRISCQSQIEKAIELSGISETDRIAIFGLAASPRVFEASVSLLENYDSAIKRDDSFLELNFKKARFLRKLHNFPPSCSYEQLLVYLRERSVLLILDR